MAIIPNPAFLGEDGRPRLGQYFVLFGADWNTPRDRPQILDIPETMMDPEFYPLQVGWRVIATDAEEMIGFPGTITKIWQDFRESRYREPGAWRCEVMLD
jgi:hypothetical protein